MTMKTMLKKEINQKQIKTRTKTLNCKGEFIFDVSIFVFTSFTCNASIFNKNLPYIFSRSEFEEGRKKLYDLLEKVEGCSHVTDVPTRYVLHDGDLVEMDISENTALHRVHGYLMNDGFMVATWQPNRRGPVR